MVWIRYGKIRVIWKCTTSRGYDTKYHAVGVSIKDEYEKKPEEDIENWANRLGDFVARKMCQNACGSLSTSVFCDEGSTQSETVYTSEMLVTKPGIKEEKVEEEKVEEEKVEEEKVEEEKVEEEKVEEEKVEEEKVEEEKVEEKAKRLKVPKYILEQIEMLEDRYKESESEEEKKIIMKAIKKLRQTYKTI